MWIVLAILIGWCGYLSVGQCNLFIWYRTLDRKREEMLADFSSRLTTVHDDLSASIELRNKNRVDDFTALTLRLLELERWRYDLRRWVATLAQAWAKPSDGAKVDKLAVSTQFDKSEAKPYRPQLEHSNGKYIISNADGTDVDPKARYWVLRLDIQERLGPLGVCHNSASRDAMREYIRALHKLKHLAGVNELIRDAENYYEGSV